MLKTFKNAYLFLYNGAMCVGWAAVLFLALDHLKKNEGDFTGVYDAVELPLKIFQTGAALEIFHSVTGIVRSPVSTTVIQVFSRVFLLWAIAHSVVETRTHWAFTTMVVSWSMTEIPRYFYYMVNTLTTPGYPLLWMRYSTFLPLYPTGAGSEAFLIFVALPFVKKSGVFSLTMPNALNFAFDFHIFLILVLLSYIPGLPHMYSHMMRQRRKQLSPADANKKSA
eukprot:TRINITY_DN255_c0_g1::TRINITY_DN255_c0_g1_i1::g.1654::m.1654 TRINITY_DN255_c0_g1::TRINITY_DN255_c0_g1_i1::g.1654  ORF type:complete len:224 (+),score=39.70,sp/Q8VZB2/HACD_ARATH/49.77/2e-63,PTPLA/PF04387.9/2.5e-58 TRINITY_DN255_c0_g1_i1:55-726(+)